MTFFNYFFPQAIFQTESQFNKKIEVIRQFGQNTLRVGGLEQSGPLVESLWRTALKSIRLGKDKPLRILILGLGGGSLVKLLRRFTPASRITAVEIDPAIIRLVGKYFDLKKSGDLKIICADAFDFVKRPRSQQYDLILVDLYLGKKIPHRLKDAQFLKSLKKQLAKNGTLIINHLRSRELAPELTGFEKKLREIFSEVKIIKPLINQLFVLK